AASTNAPRKTRAGSGRQPCRRSVRVSKTGTHRTEAATATRAICPCSRSVVTSPLFAPNSPALQGKGGIHVPLSNHTPRGGAGRRLLHAGGARLRRDGSGIGLGRLQHKSRLLP